MNKYNYILTALCFLFLGCYALPASAQGNKVIKVYRNGEVIRQFDASEIDYIEVEDAVEEEVGERVGVDLGSPAVSNGQPAMSVPLNLLITAIISLGAKYPPRKAIRQKIAAHTIRR